MLLKYSQQTTQIKPSDIEKAKKTLQPYVKHLQAVTAHSTYQVPESLINTPFDEQAFGLCWQLKNKLVTAELKYIFIVGIGGSVLATKGIYTALKTKTPSPEIIFIEYLNVLDPQTKNIKNPQEYLLIVISKTGKTYEVNQSYDHLKQQLPEVNKQTVIITDKDSALWHQATKNEIACLTLPTTVPGRFSAFTAVTVFPLMCAGFDVLSFMEGGMKARTDMLLDFTALSLLVKKPIHNLFSLDIRLQDFSFWFKQIYAESLGKEFDLKGKQLHTGVTPIYTQAPSDYHSQLQLYLGGLNDKFTLFFATDSLQRDSFLTKSFDIIKRRYEDKKRPFVEFKIDKLNEYEFGYLAMFLMIHVILLGVLMGVNPFDQPEITSLKNELK